MFELPRGQPVKYVYEKMKKKIFGSINKCSKHSEEGSENMYTKKNSVTFIDFNSYWAQFYNGGTLYEKKIGKHK